MGVEDGGVSLALKRQHPVHLPRAIEPIEPPVEVMATEGWLQSGLLYSALVYWHSFVLDCELPSRVFPEGDDQRVSDVARVACFRHSSKSASIPPEL